MRDSLLLLLFAARHYGYPHLPYAWWGEAFAAAGSVCIIALVLLLRPWWPLGAWIVGEELLVAGCSVWWIVDPWDMTGQEEQCSARVGLKIGAVGLVLLAYTTQALALKTFTAILPKNGASE